jgi:hypothetical protein
MEVNPEAFLFDRKLCISQWSHFVAVENSTFSPLITTRGWHMIATTPIFFLRKM